MEWDQLADTLGGLTWRERLAWLRGAALVLAAMLAVLLAEWLCLRRAGKASSWARMRAVSLILAPVTVVSVMVPALSVGGPAALGVFYVGLLGVAPVLWFGGHRWLGRRLRPSLSGVESLGLALSGIAICAIPAAAIGFAGSALQQAARVQARTARTDASIAHAVGPVRRFVVPGAGVVLAQSLTAPAGITLEAVDTRVNGPWYPAAGISQPTFCMDGNDLHLMWSELETPPQLRLHTRDALGRLARSVFVPGDAAGSRAPSTEFTILFREDGIDPVAPIPRSRVHLGYVQADGRAYQGAPLQSQPGEPARDNCIVQGHRRVAAASEGRIDSVYLLFHLQGRPPLVGEVRRSPGRP